MPERRSTDYAPHRSRGDQQVGRAALHLAARPPAPETAREAPPVDLDEEVARSVAAIERTVENFGALRDNIRFYEDIADDLRHDLRLEKEQNKETLQRLADTDRLFKAERERAMHAETCAEDFSLVVRDLERQLEKLRSQTIRMVKAVSVLMGSDREAVSELGDDERSAA